MKTAHPDDRLLSAFALGDMDPEEAVALADHIDACPRCANRAVELDPMALLLAAAPAPSVPADLADAILAAAATDRVRPPPRLRVEPFVAVALMAASALLMVGIGRPAELLTGAVSVARAAQALVGPAWQLAGAAPGAGAVVGLFGLAFAVVVAQRRDADGDRP